MSVTVTGPTLSLDMKDILVRLKVLSVIIKICRLNLYYVFAPIYQMLYTLLLTFSILGVLNLTENNLLLKKLLCAR